MQPQLNQRHHFSLRHTHTHTYTQNPNERRRRRPRHDGTNFENFLSAFCATQHSSTATHERVSNIAVCVFLVFIYSPESLTPIHTHTRSIPYKNWSTPSSCPLFPLHHPQLIYSWVLCFCFCGALHTRFSSESPYLCASSLLSSCSWSVPSCRFSSPRSKCVRESWGPLVEFQKKVSLFLLWKFFNNNKFFFFL